MTLLALGINHKTASVEVRERLAITPAVMEDALLNIKAFAGLNEIAILSTCNRTEIYCSANSHSESEVLQWLSDYKQLPLSDIEQNIYSHSDQAAIQHMMRVACGLDLSLIHI